MDCKVDRRFRGTTLFVLLCSINPLTPSTHLYTIFYRSSNCPCCTGWPVKHGRVFLVPGEKWHMYSSVHWTSYFLQFTSKTRPCLTGHPVGEDLDYLDGDHCVFGEVVEGLDVLDKINLTICDKDNRPYQVMTFFKKLFFSDKVIKNFVQNFLPYFLILSESRDWYWFFFPF